MQWSAAAPCGSRGAVSMPEALCDLARRLLPQGAGLGLSDPRQFYPLEPAEEQPRAVTARLFEFSAGRHAARLALGELGVSARAIPMQSDRSPLWPEGIVGSISHSRSACLAAVWRGRGIGLDLEVAEGLEEELWPTVFSVSEQDWIRGQRQPGLAAKLIFSAKEAAYKAQYAESGQLFGFETFEIAVTGQRFTASFTETIPPFAKGENVQGSWGIAEGHILTLVSL